MGSTKDDFPRDVEEVGGTFLPGMPRLLERARRGEFHDFETPHATPKMLLAGELAEIGKNSKQAKAICDELIKKVTLGAYDEPPPWRGR